ncbi:MAG: hypothetical protein ACOY5W_01195 [Pseudomonadota bacterium]
MRRLTLTLFAAAALAASPGGISTLHAADTHAHDSHAHGSPGEQQVPIPDGGGRWETDEALRHGMAGIRELVDAHRRQGAGDYPGLARGVRSNVDHVIGNCKLDPEADAALHAVLGEMFEGIALLEGEKGENARGEGVERIARALDQYGRYFDHPGWTDPHAAH